MNPERWKKIEHVLQAALQRPPGERATMLDEACAGDAALRMEVESLLASEQGAQKFLEVNALQDAASLITHATSISPGDRIGPYALEAQIGSGGMGVVYLARDVRLGRKVALKLLDPTLIGDSISRSRFIREARLASALDHPNICTIHEVGEASGRLFIAMQYVEGNGLRRLILGQPLNLESLLSISLQVADALATAHSRGIIHRDIKAGNIIITPQGLAKVLDFGIAKLLEQADGEDLNLTRTGVIMGTPSSMSPEQARGDHVDHRSDIFSFGVILYEMATGHLPFHGKSRAEVMSALLNQSHQPAFELNRELPARLSGLIDRALEKNPANRFQSMPEMIAELRGVVREAGGLNHFLDSSNAFRGVAPLIPPRRRTSIGILGRQIPKRVAVGLAAVAVIAAIGLAVAFYRARSERPATIPSRSAASQPTTKINSLAVLPFKPLVSANRDEALEMGMADTLILKLSGMQEFVVRPINAVRKYAELEQDAVSAGREQKVDAVLDGSIQKSADKVRVTVRLVQVEDGKQLWAESFDEKFTDIFALQDRVSERVVGVLALRLKGQEQVSLTKHYTDNPDAYELYLKGRYHLNRLTDDGFFKGRDYLKQATEKDPNYALAYAGLADAHNRLSGWNALAPREGFPIARAAAMKALELDDSLAEAHTAMGVVKLFHDWDWSGAERELSRAVELNQSSSDAHQMYSYCLMLAGRFEASLGEMTRAQQLDPLSLEKIAGIGEILFYQRQYDKAINQYQKALEMDPNSGFIHWAIGNVYVHQGKYQEAIAEYKKAIPLSGNSPDEPAGLGYAYALAGQKRDAQAIIDDLKARSNRSYISPALIAFVYIGLGEKDQAFAWLEKAFEGRDILLAYLKVEPMFDPLRTDPRFTKLLQRTGRNH